MAEGMKELKGERGEREEGILGRGRVDTIGKQEEGTGAASLAYGVQLLLFLHLLLKVLLYHRSSVTCVEEEK